ncbi:serine hydrolase domain-containing protein [Lacisediminihabitans profunda]|nr:serine hydrolase domain-containing protein [Lacisediminihabitans profunda]
MSTVNRRFTLRPTRQRGSRRWVRRAAAAFVLVVVPTGMLFQSLRSGHYADDSWVGILMAAVLIVLFVATRRLAPTLLVAALVVGLTVWAATPSALASPTGDSLVLARIDRARESGFLTRQHDIAVASVSLHDAAPVRFAGIGASDATPMEIGSLTKAMTGLVIADSVRRGEIRLDTPISTYLPHLAGVPAGTVTMQELVTHTSGYAAFGPTVLRRAAWSAPFGRNFLDGDLGELYGDARQGTLETRGTYSYSTLGAAIAGQAAAAAAGMTYPELMQARLFGPLGMTHTFIQGAHALVPGGWSTSGLAVQPWLLGAYAPGGGGVSTTRDLAILATALLDGSAPGMSALDPTTATTQTDTQVGIFWHTSTLTSGTDVTWHGGQTGGYTTYFGLDRTAGTAAIVLSDVANPSTDALGVALLTDTN